MFVTLLGISMLVSVLSFTPIIVNVLAVEVNLNGNNFSSTFHFAVYVAFLLGIINV